MLTITIFFVKCEHGHAVEKYCLEKRGRKKEINVMKSFSSIADQTHTVLISHVVEALRLAYLRA